MEIFISWSGERSKRVAELLKTWLKCVIQASEPWISSEDIAKGSIWFSAINDKLANVTSGIVCLTNENRGKPWLLFEAGAMLKGIKTNKVYTFLIDINPESVQNPLAQFNHTLPDKESVKKLVTSINIDLGKQSLEKNIIDDVFETYWPQFEQKFKEIISQTNTAKEKVELTEKEMLKQLINESTMNRYYLENLFTKLYSDFKINTEMINYEIKKNQTQVMNNFWAKFKDSIIDSFKEDYKSKSSFESIVCDLHDKDSVIVKFLSL
ncbi:MAG: toll/interleukin-1 receptor domain-containing protein [Parafilimonas sp.]|nr:toll/interleukin-1 receptor domain-containing protein [Parafilimonas sp.]